MRKNIAVYNPVYPLFKYYVGFWDWAERTLYNRMVKRDHDVYKRAIEFNSIEDFKTSSFDAEVDQERITKDGLKISDYVKQYGSRGPSLFLRALRKDGAYKNTSDKDIAKLSDMSDEITNIIRGSVFECPICGEIFSRFNTKYEVYNNHKLSNKKILFGKKVNNCREFTKSMIDSIDDNAVREKIGYDVCSDAYYISLNHIMAHSFWQKLVTWYKYKRLQPSRHSMGRVKPV